MLAIVSGEIWIEQKNTKNIYTERKKVLNQIKDKQNDRWNKSEEKNEKKLTKTRINQLKIIGEKKTET